ncbi:phosphoenolpyruvate--protein phosphotransferase [Serinicoccus sp. CUA-874]|uniref:phosphoenolpyruvate--protein phosphotransferase n=1 Tax=Serinicoccus sp. CUA-874 TaxID=1517939 RepID=UPI001EDB28FD|nr:phosphoenolpyruvate--protein phosphotransferase [Serinicoccus sp. CUA-874]
MRDPELSADADRRIGEGRPAALAWQDAVDAVADRFERLPDAYLQERAQDVRSIGERVMRLLLGVTEPESLGEGILVVDELDPALAISLDAAEIQGVVTRRGGGLGHGVLIARARGVPVLTGVGDRAAVTAGTMIAFDVRSGRLEIDPPAEVQAAFGDMLDRRRRERERALADAHLPALTRDGARVAVKANVSSVATARLGAGLGAQGSGLVRTEAVFAQWHRAPTVEQQVEVYTAMAEAFAPHPVTVRTWDVGGDKPLDFIPVAEEANPFLGVRGIRAFRDDPGLLLDQLEALCRVARTHRINVLFPMVTSVDDVDWSRARLQEAARRVGLSAPPHQLGVGIMVEVPAVAVRLTRLARGLDFVSIGTNDLSQYTLAAERGNPAVSRWSDALDPALLQLVRYICDRAPQGVVVSVCGELASDPDVAGLLVGLGVRELSASPSAVPTVKARLRTVSLRELQDLAAGAVAARDAAAVRELLLTAP